MLPLESGYDYDFYQNITFFKFLTTIFNFTIQRRFWSVHFISNFNKFHPNIFQQMKLNIS